MYLHWGSHSFVYGGLYEADAISILYRIKPLSMYLRYPLESYQGGWYRYQGLIRLRKPRLWNGKVIGV